MSLCSCSRNADLPFCLLSLGPLLRRDVLIFYILSFSTPEDNDASKTGGACADSKANAFSVERPALLLRLHCCSICDQRLACAWLAPSCQSTAHKSIMRMSRMTPAVPRLQISCLIEWRVPREGLGGRATTMVHLYQCTLQPIERLPCEEPCVWEASVLRLPWYSRAHTCP